MAQAMPRAAGTVTHVVRAPGLQLAQEPTVDQPAVDISEALSLGTTRPNERGAVRVGYVMDRFPRGSHSFVLQEILELESRGIDVHIFSLGMPDGRLDDTSAALARLQGPVCYFLADSEAGASVPDETTVATDRIGSGMTSRAAHWSARRLRSGASSTCTRTARRWPPKW
jgi:hypothetical protein